MSTLEISSNICELPKSTRMKGRVLFYLGAMGMLGAWLHLAMELQVTPRTSGFLLAVLISIFMSGVIFKFRPGNIQTMIMDRKRQGSFPLKGSPGSFQFILILMFLIRLVEFFKTQDRTLIQGYSLVLSLSIIALFIDKHFVAFVWDKNRANLKPNV